MNQPDSASGLSPAKQQTGRADRAWPSSAAVSTRRIWAIWPWRAPRVPRFALDTVLFAPVGMQPLKPEGPAASFEDRLAMTRLAIAGEPGFEVSLADAPKARNRAMPAHPQPEPRPITRSTRSSGLRTCSRARLRALLPDGRGLVLRAAPLAPRRGDPFCGAVDRGLAAGAAAPGSEG